MKFVLPSRRKRGVYTVTDARRSVSEDISYRQRRYLISMGVRVVAFLLAVFLFHGVWRFIAAAIALVVPYFAVVFANGGREPENTAGFEPFEPNLPERTGPAGSPPAPPDITAGDGGYAGGDWAPADAEAGGTAQSTSYDGTTAAPDGAAPDDAAHGHVQTGRADTDQAAAGWGHTGGKASWHRGSAPP